MHYLVALDILHRRLQPATYVEIGCRKGGSLSKARCPSLAIDPDFEIRHALEAPTRIFKETSDDFFAKRNLTALIGGVFDLAYIDGMHRAEYALRDFINLERHAGPNSVIMIDDILPQDIAMTARERGDKVAWTGDVYKVIALLRRLRPELHIDVFDIDMKGLCVIHGLDRANTVLSDASEANEAFLISQQSELASVADIRATLAPRLVSEFDGYVEKLAENRQSAAGVAGGAVRGGGAAQEAYLDLMKRSLLNEIYLDDELRMLYLRDCLDGKESFDYAIYHDIRNTRRDAYQALQLRRGVGQFPERNIHRSGFSHTMVGRKRLDNVHHTLDVVRQNDVPGDFVECGVWRGGSCILMAGYAGIYNMADRTTFVVDSFEGLPPPTYEQDGKMDLSKDKFPELAVSLETVRENFEVYGVPLDNIRFLKGWFKDTLPEAPIDKIALLRLDGDLYESTMDAMNALYHKVVPGGVVIIDDYGCIAACKQAIDDYFEANNMALPQIEKVDWTGVWWRKDS